MVGSYPTPIMYKLINWWLEQLWLSSIIVCLTLYKIKTHVSQNIWQCLLRRGAYYWTVKPELTLLRHIGNAEMRKFRKGKSKSRRNGIKIYLHPFGVLQQFIHRAIIIASPSGFLVSWPSTFQPNINTTTIFNFTGFSPGFLRFFPSWSLIIILLLSYSC